MRLNTINAAFIGNVYIASLELSTYKSPQMREKAERKERGRQMFSTAG